MSDPAGRRRPAGAAIMLVLAGGLALAGAGTGTWVSETTVRDVGGVPIEDIVTTPGTEIAGPLLPIGVAAAVLGLTLAVVRGTPQRVVGVLAAVLGVVAIAVAVSGALRAAALPGESTGMIALAGIAALGIAAGGVLASRAPAEASVLDDRYTVEGGTADDDWTLGSTDEPPPGETER